MKQLFVCFCCAGWGHALLKQLLAYFQTTELVYDAAGATPSWGGRGEGWLSLELFSRGLPWRTFVWQPVGPPLGAQHVEYWLLDIPCKIQWMLQKEHKCASLTGDPWAGSASVREDIRDTVIMQRDEETLRGVYLAIVS